MNKYSKTSELKKNVPKKWKLCFRIPILTQVTGVVFYSSVK